MYFGGPVFLFIGALYLGSVSMRIAVFGISILLALFISSGAVHASVIHYDEMIQGELGNTGNANANTSVGNFDIGINTVSGSLNYTITTGEGDYTDPFRFNIIAGQELRSVSLLFSASAPLSTLTFVFLDMAPFQMLDLITVDGTSASPLSVLTSILPLGEDEYYLSASSFSGQEGTIVDYTWRFEVAAVPAPPTIYLLATGLLGIVCFRNPHKGTHGQT